MTLRTTIFAWVLALVVVVLGVTIGTIAVAFDRSTRARVAAELVRSREVTLDLQKNRQSLYRQECRVVAEEPRLRAVVATEDVAHDTVFDVVRTLAGTLGAGVFVIVDADGRLLADHVDAAAVDFDLSDRPLVARTLADGDADGVWIADGKPFLVQGCRLEFGARVVGALFVGHALDDDFVATVARQTGGVLIVAVDGAPVTRLPMPIKAEDIAPALKRVRAGASELSVAGVHWFAQRVPVPGYVGEHAVELLLLRSIDEALAPGRQVLRLVFGLVIGAAIATLLLALGLAHRLARPIQALVARTQAIAGGDLGPRAVAGPTEVRALGAAMDRMAREVDASRQSLAENERLGRELEIAARIQTSILPRDLQVDGLEIAAQMMTATEVGGDYYDVLPVEGGAWLAIGDASGHGLTAGLVMMMVQTGVATLVRARPDDAPRELIRTLNRVLYENVHERLQADRHMTLSLLRYQADGAIVVAGAHMDAVVWRAATAEVELLSTPGTFLAISDDIDEVNVEHRWRLSADDVVVLLTDGVTEAEDAAGVQLGYDRIQAAVHAHATEPVAAIRTALFAVLTAHSPVLADDATILVLRYVGDDRAS